MFECRPRAPFTSAMATELRRFFVTAVVTHSLSVGMVMMGAPPSDVVRGVDTAYGATSAGRGAKEGTLPSDGEVILRRRVRFP